MIRVQDQDNPKIWHHKDTRVWYECSIHRSKASMLRLIEAIVDFGITSGASYDMGASYAKRGIPMRGSTVVMMLRIEYENLEAIKAVIQPYRFDYRSPTWFNNGSITPYHSSPEDEIEARWQTYLLERPK